MLSIVIVSYNTRDLLRGCLASLAGHAPDAEVVVVDNDSRDGSAEMAEAEFPAVTVVRAGSNLGFAGGNNLGLHHVTGDTVLLLNSDTVVTDDALTRCVVWLRGHPRVGALTARLIGPDGKPQGCVHPFPSLYRVLRESLRYGNRPPGQAGVTDGWLAGTALFLRGEALVAVGGGLDGGYFIYWEDADLSAAIRAAGWELAVHPDAAVRHYGGASGGGDDASRRADLQAWYDYGRFRWFAKHRPWAECFALWCHEWTRVLRMRLRAWLRPGRASEAHHARVLAAALLRWPFGLSPPTPGRRPATKG